MSVSVVEQDFILEGLYHQCREDGRGPFDLRPFTLETGLLAQASGSARLRRPGTGTGGDVLVGVKVEIGDLLTSQQRRSTADQQRGRVVCSVETYRLALYISIGEAMCYGIENHISN